MLLAAPAIAASHNLAAAAAEKFPSRPLRLIVPYAAGGGTDAIARVVAHAAGDKLRQTIIVENMGGAGGNLATKAAAGAAPDGYTILMANQGPMTVNPHLFKDMRIDPLTAFDPICLLAVAPLVVVVPEFSKFTSFKELVDAARAKPNTLNYGSAGIGSASHLATLLFDAELKLKTVHVPYRGAGPALNDLLGGQTQFMITTLPSVIGLIEGKKVRALAVTTKTRSPLLAAVPTVAESGAPNYESGAWYGFVVPRKTPKAIIDAIRAATVDALGQDLVRKRLAAEGAQPVGNTPEEFAAFMRAESARWEVTLKTAGLAATN